MSTTAVKARDGDAVGVRFGVVADVHLGPADAPATRWFGEIRPGAAVGLLRRGLGRLVGEGVDGLLLAGDLSERGDAVSLAAGLAEAASLGRPVWAVPGNHDLAGGDDALARAVAGLGEARVPPMAGEVARLGVRIAGLPVASDDGGRTVRVDGGGLDLADWGNDAVLLLSHYPLLSRRGAAEAAGLRYAGDLAGAEGAWRRLVGRPRPTVVLHGHLHLRDGVAEGAALQLGFGALADAGHEVAVVEVATGGGGVEVTARAFGVGEPGEPGVTPAIEPLCWSWRFRSGRWAPGVGGPGG